MVRRGALFEGAALIAFALQCGKVDDRAQSMCLFAQTLLRAPEPPEPPHPRPRLTAMRCDQASNQTGETTMIRKFAIAAAAVAALGTASLTASTPAAAWGKGGGFHGHHFHGGGLRIYSGVGLYEYDS